MATGRMNVNGKVNDAYFVYEKDSIKVFKNIGVAGYYLCKGESSDIVGLCGDRFSQQEKSFEFVHTLMVGLKTFKGEILAQVPPFDPAIRSIVKDCRGDN